MKKCAAISIRQTNTLTTFNIVVCFELGFNNDRKPCIVHNKILKWFVKCNATDAKIESDPILPLHCAWH